MNANVFGTTAEERAHALVMRLPVLPTMLPPEDPARIVAELLENPPFDDECGDDFCPGCESLQDQVDDIEAANDELGDFVDGVRELLGLSPSGRAHEEGLDDLLELLKERLARTGEGA